MTATIDPGGRPPEQSSQFKVRTVVGFLVFCELASGFTQGYYPPLLAKIARHLSVSDADITWFLTVQTLAAAVCVPLLSKLGDQFGHRRILRIAVVSVLAGTLITALSSNIALVLASRVLVGPLAVWLPLEIALVHSRVTGETARKSIGLLVSFLTGGAIIGTLASGQISRLTSSLLITLLVPTLLVVMSAYAVFFKVPESTYRSKGKVDVVGFVGLAIAMVALLSSLRLASSAGIAAVSTLATFAVAALALVLWVWWELRTDAPAIDVRLIVSRKVGPIYLAAFCFGMVMFGGQSPLTTFLSSDPAKVGYGFGATPASASLVLALITLLATIGGATFAHLAAVIGIRAVMLLGASLPALGYGFQIAFHTQMWQIWLASALSGIGMGFLLGSLPALLAELAPSGETGIAAGVYNSLRTLGGAAAGAVFALLLSTFTTADGTPSISGYLGVWGVSLSAFVVCIGAIMLLPIPDGPSTRRERMAA